MMKEPGQPSAIPAMSEDEKTSKEDAYFIRHSKSSYKTYAEIEKSQNPRAAFDPENQITPDLTQEGIKLAKEKAEEFFGSLNPAQDKIFFISSNEARALETANIYREVARAHGFEIVKPDKSGSSVAERIGNGEIRTIENLSLNPKNTVLSNIFLPENLLRDINWGAIDEDFRKKWKLAREIIKNADQGSYGANLHMHSEAIKKIFPEIETSRELYERQFNNLLRLAKWAESKFKIKENKIKVVAFGHENYILEVLDECFQTQGINNCETISLALNDDNPTLSFRGREATV